MKVVLLKHKDEIEYFDNLTTTIIIHRGRRYAKRKN